MSATLELLDEPDDGVRRLILDGLVDYNLAHVTAGMTNQTLAVAIRENGDIVGGLWGRTGMGWMTIELIFVPERLRGQSMATRLIAIAEAEALRRDCCAAWIETLNPQARALYERLGFEVFGELKNFPPGNSRVFLQKKLQPSKT